MDTKLQQQDFDDLSAYLDGELPEADAQRVERLIQDQASWRQAHAQLQALSAAMDAVEAPAAPAGLAERIKERIHAELQQDDFDDLSAYLDGELPAADARRVETLIRENVAWRRSYQELQAVSTALDAFEAPAAPPALAGRIQAQIRAQRQAPVVIRLVRWLAPAAAAAAVLIAATFAFKSIPSGGGPIAQAPKAPAADSAKVDTFIVENLEFFRDMDVVNNLETIEAIQDAEESVGT